MSDTSQGEGWWLASDGKWYPPTSLPGPPAPPPEPEPVPTQGFREMARSAVSNVPTDFYHADNIFAEMDQRGIAPTTVHAASWAHFSEHAIETGFGDKGLAIFHERGVLFTDGLARGLGKRIKVHEVTIPPCNSFGPRDSSTEHHQKYGIEFGGPGNVMLGRIEWRVYPEKKGFKYTDPRDRMMKAATERDRIVEILNALLH